MNTSRIVLAVLLAAALAASSALAQTLPSSQAHTQATSAPATAESQPKDESDDWGSPGLGLFALAMLIIMLLVVALLLGIGVVIGLFVLGLTAFLAILGVVSSSAAIGLATRSPGTALKVLLAQLGALAGACCGIVVAWFLNHLFRMGFTHNWFLVAGGVGLVAGAGVALASCFVCGAVVNWSVKKFKAKRPS